MDADTEKRVRLLEEYSKIPMEIAFLNLKLRENETDRVRWSGF